MRSIFAIEYKILQKAGIVTLVLFAFLLPNSYSQYRDCIYVQSEPTRYSRDTVKIKNALVRIENLKEDRGFVDSELLPGISGQQIIRDLEYMIEYPNSTQLNDSGYYCGVVVVLNWLLNYDPEKYVKAVLDLLIRGEAHVTNGSRPIKLPVAAIRKVDFSVSFEGDKRVYADIGSVSISDFILGISLVYSEKKLQRFGLIWADALHRKSCMGNFLFANTMPWELDDLFSMVGAKMKRQSYYSPLEAELQVLETIENAVVSGYIPVLMENHLITSDRSKNYFYRLFGAHFITVHYFRVNEACNTVSLSYWDYGAVKNYREQSEKGSPLAAKTFRAALRRSRKLNKIKEDGTCLEIPIPLFMKGLKGYWIPEVRGKETFLEHK